jgi:nicotinate phosphoribosyltransferase
MNYQESALLTDLYQLTMMQGYYEHGMDGASTFEFFVRKLPENRGFLMAAGLETTLEYLENLRITPEELKWIAQSGLFHKGFVEYLESVRFTGDVDAMEEGTVFFPNEPVLRVTAPLPQAQLVESRIINLLHFQTLIASKAVRVALAAPGKLLVDFGFRRAHGAEAGLLAARASYIAGISGTATVLASMIYGIPVYGTMAHSFVLAHDDETEAFAHFAMSQPNNVIFILDTYDTEKAAHKVVSLAPKLKEKGITIKGVRLDSGDLADHARKVRTILDDGALSGTKIFVSGGLDEYSLSDLVNTGAPIDGFGIGTCMDTSSDAPYLDSAYKLQEYAGKARRKRSEGKATLPGTKQVYRFYDEAGKIKEDVIALDGELQDGQPLLKPVMRSGKRVSPPPSIEALRQHGATQLTCLPDRLKTIRTPGSYTVKLSQSIKDLIQTLDSRF